MAAVDWFAARGAAPAPQPAPPARRGAPARRRSRASARAAAHGRHRLDLALRSAAHRRRRAQRRRAAHEHARDKLDKQELQLRAENAALASQVSSASSARRIEATRAQARARAGTGDRHELPRPRTEVGRWRGSSIRASGCCCSRSSSVRRAARARCVDRRPCSAVVALRRSRRRRRRRRSCCPPARGTIFDAMGTPLAIGEQATTVYADPHEVTRPAHEAARRGAACSALEPNASTAAHDRPTRTSSTSQRKATPKRGALDARSFRASASTPRSAASIRRAPSRAQVLGYAGIDNTGLSGLELELDTASSRDARAARRSSAIRSGAPIDVDRRRSPRATASDVS